MLVLVQLVVVAGTPPKVTVPPLPNPEPEMVIEFPGKPLLGFKPVITGALNPMELLERPPLVTTTLPMVEMGAIATMLTSDQLETVALVPPKVTVPVVVPKFLPEIVTDVPELPLAGERPVMVGTNTVKITPLLCKPPAVTTTLPLVAPFGTTATMLLFDQLETAAEIPLKVIVPVVDPKPVPKI